MLQKNPAKRITLPQVKEHPFFKTINWENLLAQKVPPPLRLSSKDYDDDGSDQDEVDFLSVSRMSTNTVMKKKRAFRDLDYT